LRSVPSQRNGVLTAAVSAIVLVRQMRYKAIQL
jgi:hypothetical protein